jgi:hypothetical protein
MADFISYVKAFYKLYNKTDVYVVPGEYDVICTEKLLMTEEICIFSVHITSYSPAKKSIFVF